MNPEEFELYVQMGTTFQLCKICTENDKVSNDCLLYLLEEILRLRFPIIAPLVLAEPALRQ